MLFTVMAEYSEPAKARRRDFPPHPFSPPLPSAHCHILSEKKKANPACMEKVTDSCSHKKKKHSGKSLAGVDRVCVVFGEALFMQPEQTFFSNKADVVDLCASPLHPCTPTTHTPPYLPASDIGSGI